MDYAMDQPDFKKNFNRRKPQPLQWLSLPVGSAQCHLSLTVTKDQIGTELYIRDNKELFNVLFEHKNEIEKDLGFKMDWQELSGRKASRINVSFSGDFTKLIGNEKDFKWYCEKAIALKKTFSKYI